MVVSSRSERENLGSNPSPAAKYYLRLLIGVSGIVAEMR